MERGQLFDGRLPIKPPLGPAELAQIPGKRGVLLLEGDGAPLLLVTAADIRSRLRYRLTAPDAQAAASKRADLREVATAVSWKLAGSRFGADWQFLELARVIYPDTYRDLLAFQPPWFVRIDLSADLPAFTIVHDAGGGSAKYLGPFPRRAAAAAFIDILEDVFGLCRHEQIARGGRDASCVYGQMGKCQLLCLGRISHEDYRRQVADVYEFAAGRGDLRDRLDVQMRQCAADRQYEQAGKLKARLARLAELAGEDYQHVAPLENFQYLMFQKTASKGRADIFLIDRGHIEQAATLPFPPPAEEVAKLLARLGELAGHDRPMDPAGRHRLALVVNYLFSPPERAGLFVRLGRHAMPEELAEFLKDSDLLTRKESRPGDRPQP